MFRDVPLDGAEPKTDGGIEAVEKKILIEKMLDALPRRKRRVVELALAGYTQAEIGEKLGIYQSTVSRIYDSAVSFLTGRFSA